MPLRSRRRPNVLQRLPRRFQIAFGLSLVFFTLLVFSIVTSETTPAVPTVADLKESAQQAANIIHHSEIPQLWNPFSTNAHEPLEQANSSRGDSRWYSDLNWLNPFSSSVTLDNERTLLPPAGSRTPIYTFYTTADKKNKDIVAVENELILQWRRAWWAQGFKPVVLGHPEAMKHPSYDKLDDLKLNSILRRDFERWLAWAHMGGGVMANWLVFPMAAYNNPTLETLRTRDYEKLRRFSGLEQALLCGKKEDIDHAIQVALGRDAKASASNLVDILPKDLFQVESRRDGIAFYDSLTITKQYARVASDMAHSEQSGLSALTRLINSHLQNTWQNTFTSGIAVLTSTSDQLTSLTEQAFRIAGRLGTCIESPMPESCPPNRLACTPCDSKSPVKITSPSSYVNSSTLFSIGTAQHPYTYNALHHMQDDIMDARFIRRNTTRDQWLTDITANFINQNVSGPQRLIQFKEAVASPASAWRSLWLIGERESDEPLDLDWLFGFTLPSLSKDVERMHLLDVQSKEGRMREDTKERNRLVQSKKIISAVSGQAKKSAEMVAAWNMADAEAWRFVKAYDARRIVERLNWEDEEKRFAGTEKTLGWFEKPKAGD